jgi:hypothetical protein
VWKWELKVQGLLYLWHAEARAHYDSLLYSIGKKPIYFLKDGYNQTKNLTISELKSVGMYVTQLWRGPERRARAA